MKNVQHNPLNDSELFRPLCRYFMLTKALFSVYLSYTQFPRKMIINSIFTLLIKYCKIENSTFSLFLHRM